ncbi:MAG: hypothetical protein ACK5MU_03950 [Candidatus Saccharimonadales bacterium]
MQAIKQIGDANKTIPIALRITDKELYGRVSKLSEEQSLSLNMTVNMLLGYAFNEIDRQKKTFVKTIMFESK